MAPTHYDPTSEQEKPVPLPSAPAITISDNIVLQPPLSRRGTGPGLLIILPPNEDITPSTKPEKPLDPNPVTKWAEEGFAVVSAFSSEDLDINSTIDQALNAFDACPEVDIKNKFGVIVYDRSQIFAFSEALENHPRVQALVGYGSFSAPASNVPTLLHLTANAPRPRHPPNNLVKQHSYPITSTHFVLPSSSEYEPNQAAIAHSRTLIFLRAQLGGPFFDLEAIWDEHCYFEFEMRSVAQTMGTMVAEPYVNHVPTMTGGIGRKLLTEFYRDHFIFSNPADARLETISRTIGADRVVDEFVYHITHDRVVDWLLPQVPPTGRVLAVPMMAVVNIRGDRLYNAEHIWWDQATVLRQAGILPDMLPFTDPKHPREGPKMLRIPVAGIESALMLQDEMSGRSNDMFGPGWGIQDSDA
ncbi:hypothetical protein CVT24_002020 [Panaeolus cyanescens]|uniref:SnoaL-like domain-containing protein n=1 Tax=Panaeolus cyanescens TaxID=181874 RepID=A0A409YHH5_9AGAR|nr:hypothetical protein CVT24_002020 [Panaeolus cyanescens]